MACALADDAAVGGVIDGRDESAVGARAGAGAREERVVVGARGTGGWRERAGEGT